MRRCVQLFLAAWFLAGHTSAQDFVPAPPAELSQTAPTPSSEEIPPPTSQQPEQPPAQSREQKREKPRAKRSWFSRMLNPFGSSSKRVAPNYQDPKLRGLVLDLQISPQTVRLSEVRQLEVKVIVSNIGKRAVDLDFPNNQRIEIYLMNSAEIVLTRWSDNRAITATSGSLLINPGEQVEYNETIATRDLTPNKVFILEAFFPKYPELRVRQKFLAAP